MAASRNGDKEMIIRTATIESIAQAKSLLVGYDGDPCSCGERSK